MMKTSFFPAVCLVFLLLTEVHGSTPDPTTDIKHYRFFIALNDSTDRIEATGVISLKFMVPVSVFYLDLKNTDSTGKGMEVTSVSCVPGFRWEHSGNRLKIMLPAKSKPGTDLSLSVNWSGIPADGLIISRNKFGKRTFFADHWPDRASNYLPVKDHPSDKATVEFIITAPDHYRVVASGYLAETVSKTSGYLISHWKEDVPLPVKVMAFGAADFAVEQSGVEENIPVTSWVYSENSREGFNDYAVATKPLAFYMKLIGPYPFEKLANVQSKTIFGGLENAGCIFYSENSVTGAGRAESLIAHEIAHQWFGNSVTETDWKHIWLSEGFATYLTSVYLEKTYGNERFIQVMKSARDRILRVSERTPGSVIDTTITDLMKLLNVNTYQKGAWVLHMLRSRVGEEKFWKGIRLFYSRYMNSNASTNDFIAVMEEVCEVPLEQFFNQWLYVPGEPAIKIYKTGKKTAGGEELVIEQMQERLFSFPLEYLMTSKAGDLPGRVDIINRKTVVTVPADSDLKITLDPGTKLLFREIK